MQVPWVEWSVSLPQPFLPVYLCANVGPQGLPHTPLWGLLLVAWPDLFHNLPPCWVHQLQRCLESSLPRLPVSAPPTDLNECFFFISLFVRLPYSSIFCQFWGFFVFVFKLLLSFFWLCEEAQCVYLCLHLGRNLTYLFSPQSSHALIYTIGISPFLPLFPQFQIYLLPSLGLNHPTLLIYSVHIILIFLYWNIFCKYNFLHVCVDYLKIRTSIF